MEKASAALSAIILKNSLLNFDKFVTIFMGIAGPTCAPPCLGDHDAVVRGSVTPVLVNAMVAIMKFDLSVTTDSGAQAMAALLLSVALLEGLPDDHARRIVGSALAKLPQGNITADKARGILDGLKP